jgi:TonB family protein
LIMKFAVALLLSFFTVNSFAQVISIQYFNNSGKQFITPDSADYTRVISMPDSGSKLYNVSEYYRNKNRCSLGKSSLANSVVYEGTTVSYFENGTHKSVIKYADGRPVDTAYYFFPSGKRYMVTYCFTEKPDRKPWKDGYTIITQYDSLGNASITNGNGHYIGYDEGFKKAIEEGTVQNGKRVNGWKGTALDGKLSFTEKYEDGKLISGSATDSNGNTYQYSNERITEPSFQGGIEKLYQFLAHTVRYPAAARERGIQGRVIMRFLVNTDGSLSNFQVERSAGIDLNNETLRVLMLSPKWVPGKVCGYTTALYYHMPIQYTMPPQ